MKPIMFYFLNCCLCPQGCEVSRTIEDVLYEVRSVAVTSDTTLMWDFISFWMHGLWSLWWALIQATVKDQNSSQCPYEKASPQTDWSAICGNWRLWPGRIRDCLEFPGPITGASQHCVFFVGVVAWDCASQALGSHVFVKLSLWLGSILSPKRIWH